MRHLLTIFLIIPFVTACSQDSSEETPNLSAKTLIDVAYGTHFQQKYDLFLPENRSMNATKLIVVIHGGGWTSGDKSDFDGVFEYLQTFEGDYAIANLNYRLADAQNPPIPMQIDDINLFVAHMVSKQSEYQFNPAITFIGSSAGAHLSMLYAYRFDTEKRIKVVCNIVGPTDFLPPSYIENPNPETQQLLLNVQAIFGKNFSENTTFYQEISPFYALKKDSAPTISFYGGKDTLVPEEQGIAVHERLESLGVPHQFVLYPDEGHGFEPESYLDTFEKIEAFLKLFF